MVENIIFSENQVCYDLYGNLLLTRNFSTHYEILDGEASSIIFDSHLKLF